MMPPVLVHHRASLGDTILVWPLLRAMLGATAGAVRFASDAGKAQLAARRLGVVPVDAESRGFSRLWSDRPEVVDPELKTVIYVGGPEDAEDALRLRENLRLAFPGAEALVFPGRADRVRVRAWARELGLTPTDPPPTEYPAGPVVMHVGSGSREKCWAMERWSDLAGRLTRRGRSVRLIAGEAEAERHSADDRRMLMRAGGSYLHDLAALEAALEGARLVVACDTGPAHLAAQMGLETLVFFGPTEPERWAPAGPRVRVLKPAEPTAMAWLSVDAAEAAIG